MAVLAIVGDMDWQYGIGSTWARTGDSPFCTELTFQIMKFKDY